MNSEPRVFAAGTVLSMLHSATSILTVGLTSNSATARSTQPTVRAVSRPVRSSQGAQVQTLRGHFTRLITYFARLGYGSVNLQVQLEVGVYARLKFVFSRVLSQQPELKK